MSTEKIILIVIIIVLIILLLIRFNRSEHFSPDLQKDLWKISKKIKTIPKAIASSLDGGKIIGFQLVNNSTTPVTLEIDNSSYYCIDNLDFVDINGNTVTVAANPGNTSPWGYVIATSGMPCTFDASYFFANVVGTVNGQNNNLITLSVYQTAAGEPWQFLCNNKSSNCNQFSFEKVDCTEASDPFGYQCYKIYMSTSNNTSYCVQNTLSDSTIPTSLCITSDNAGIISSAAQSLEPGNTICWSTNTPTDNVSVMIVNVQCQNTQPGSGSPYCVVSCPIGIDTDWLNIKNVSQGNTIQISSTDVAAGDLTYNIVSNQSLPTGCSSNNDCQSGYVCSNGVCTENSCSNITSCSGIEGTSCGWCFDSNMALPGDDSGPSLGVCNNWVWESDDCNDAQTCANVTSCSGIDGTDCGWCNDLQIALYGGKHGPDWDPPFGKCQDSNWTWESSDC